jgi:hypothetical protein
MFKFTLFKGVFIKRLYVILIALISFNNLLDAQIGRVFHNTVFKPGEKVTYKIKYHWHFIWLESGEATFSVSASDYKGIQSYQFTGSGISYAKYDWFFKVRDTFQTYIDTTSFLPLRFCRFTNEGSSHITTDNIFDWVHNKVFCFSQEKGNYKQDSVLLPPNTFDVLSGIYYTRSLNFTNAKNNDTIPIILYLDGKIYHVHLRYIGKENISTSFGEFRCIKFKVSLISGTMFKQGEEMTVWATDDSNHLPLVIEAPIIIGSVKAELQSFSNIRSPMDAKVK